MLISVSNFTVFNMLTSSDAVKTNPTLNIIISSVNGFMMTILGTMYKYICSRVVGWENHMFESEMQYSYILKVFIFEFINSYITLVY